MDWFPGSGGVIRGRAGGAGTLTTRPVHFTGRHLFVNGDFQQGQLRVEVLDRNGVVIAPFTAEACAPITANGTKLAVNWHGAALADLSGRAVRFRFTLTKGRLYAFWVSANPSGASGGYPAAGGPEFSGPIDA